MLYRHPATHGLDLQKKRDQVADDIAFMSKEGTPNYREEKFSVDDAAASEPSPKQPSNPPVAARFDAVAEYVSNHATFAGVGITLQQHVIDALINEGDDLPITEGQMAALKTKSDQLNAEWMAGTVK